MRVGKTWLLVATLFAYWAAPSRLAAQDKLTPGPVAMEAAAGESAEPFQYFNLMTSPQYQIGEKIALWVTLIIAICGLGYAGMLVGQVLGADQGTEKMRTVARAIRQGANAYLYRQFKAIVGLVFLICAILYFAASSE